MNCSQCNTLLTPGARFCGVCGQPVAATAPPVAAVSSGAMPVAAPGRPRASDMIGREIANRYRILAKLGEGGMGAVFRAEQISLKRTVALKLLRPELSAEDELVRRFNAEAELAAKLSHPNTVILYDFGQDHDGTLFIAMEYLEGESLRDLLEQGPLPAARATAICEQVCASLADAHACGIVHRDLKPDNVMLTERGKKKDVVRVLDFGIAKLRDQRGDVTGMPVTQAGALLGTPQYMAPEQIRGETVDGRADVYALGVMLYEMVTGRLPFQGSSLMAVLSMHLTDVPVPPGRCRPDLAIPPALDQLIMSALEKSPDRRPPSMEYFGDTLSNIRAQLGYASQTSVATPIPGTARPSASGAAAITPVPISTPAGLATSPAAAAGASPTPVPASYTPSSHGGAALAHSAVPSYPGTAVVAPRRSRLGLWLTLVALLVAGGAVAAVLATRSSSQSSVAGDDGDDDGDDDDDDDDTNIPYPDRADDDRADDRNTDSPVSTDFFVEPKRDLYQEYGNTNAARAGTGGSNPVEFVHPSYGYGLSLPSSFREDTTGDPTMTRFIGLHKAELAIVAVAHVPLDPRSVDEQTLAALAQALAATAGGTLASTRYRKIQGHRSLTGIIDEPNFKLRYQFAILPCGYQGMVVMFGAPKTGFGKTSSFRKKLFSKYVTIPGE